LTSALLSSEILIMTSHKKHLAIAALAALTGWAAAAPALFAPGLAHAQGKPDDKGKPEGKGKPDDKGKPAPSANPAASGAKPDGSGKPDDKPGPADSANPAASPGQDPDKAKAERRDRAKRNATSCGPRCRPSSRTSRWSRR
jgi:hypothetical protein